MFWSSSFLRVLIRTGTTRFSLVAALFLLVSLVNSSYCEKIVIRLERLYPIGVAIFEGIEIISGILRDKVLQQRPPDLFNSHGVRPICALGRHQGGLSSGRSVISVALVSMWRSISLSLILSYVEFPLPLWSARVIIEMSFCLCFDNPITQALA